jgi:hypothetical protein
VPFAKTEADRMANGDPRPSIAKRYGSVSAFSAAAAAVVNRLVAQRYLLPDDGARELSKAIADVTNNGLLPP